jgi:hypothetical protein
MTNRNFFGFLFLIIILIFISSNFVSAKSGCCSWHDGVCGSRCCDGTALSARCSGSGSSYNSDYDCSFDSNNNLVCSEGGPCLGSASYCKPELVCVNYRCTKLDGNSDTINNPTGGDKLLDNKKNIRETCSSSYECESTLFCLNGKCSEKHQKNEGDRCSDSQECQESLFCEEGYCIDYFSKSEGEDCLSNEQCEILFDCVNGKCIDKYSRTSGESCFSDSHCLSIYYCIHGYCRSNKSFCGDNYCDKGEIYNCRKDCTWCGDGSCSKSEEKICKEDCIWCGDGICQVDENCNNCIKDCSCKNNQRCDNNECIYYCGNNQVDTGENCENCILDVKCSDNKKCIDSICNTYCGNGICESSEKLKCEIDCRWCGDNRCDDNEKQNCLLDCGLTENQAFKKINLKNNSKLFINSINENQDYFIVSTTNNIKLLGIIPFTKINEYKLNKLNGSVIEKNANWFTKLFFIK